MSYATTTANSAPTTTFLPVLLSIFAGLGVTYTGVKVGMGVQLSVLAGLCIMFVCLQSARANAAKAAIKAELEADRLREAEQTLRHHVRRKKR